MGIEDLRRNYEERSLERHDLAENPIQQFQLWFDELVATEAPDWFEPNAMTLATADLQGRVSARIVLLKKCSESGFVFFTNYESDKGQQLLANPLASLVFYWPHLERQVRVEGRTQKVTSELSDTYFHSRPRGSQIGAIVSPQSKVLANREEIESEVRSLETKYDGQQIPRPEYWGGYELVPQRMEFWQGRPSRLHDRFCYERIASEGSCSKSQATKTWKVDRLAP